MGLILGQLNSVLSLRLARMAQCCDRLRMAVVPFPAGVRDFSLLQSVQTGFSARPTHPMSTAGPFPGGGGGGKATGL
jgi:hypothetical protein